MPKITLRFFDLEVTIDSGNPLDEISTLAHQHMDGLIKARAIFQEPSAEDEAPSGMPDHPVITPTLPLKQQNDGLVMAGYA